VTSRAVQFRALVAAWLDADRLVGATCSEIGATFWFPDQGHHGREERLARELCHSCPVRRDCLRIALESEDRITQWGVWAGYTAVKLRRMRRLLELLACPPSKQGVTSLPIPTDEGVPDVAA
jgi:hypothetical protein